MKRFLTTCLLVMGSMAGVLPAGELKNERLFAVNFGENAAWEFGKSTSVEIPGVSALNPQTDIACSGYGTEPAKPLSATAVRLLENTRCGGLSGSFAVMPLGKTDQAVAFAAKGRVPAAAGAVTFWFRGQAWDYTATADKNKDNPKRVRFRKWDVATPLRETFCEFRAAGGAASFGKLEAGKLVLEAGGARVSAAIDFDVSLVHLLAVNYGDGKAQIHVDGVLKGEGAFTMPADVQEIVVGHVGPGSETWNRWLDDFAVWKRPLKVSEMMLLRQKEGAVQIPLQTTIPKTANAPLIDGLMKEGEWDRAAAVTGMQSLHLGGGYEVYLDGGDLSDLKDRVFLCYDDRNLYVGYHCPPPREIKGDAAMTAAMLKRGISVFDANVDSDDAIQICVQYPKPGGDLYNLFVNGINTHYDFHYGGTVEGSRLPGGCKLAWDPKWRTASTLDTAGWHLEIAIPLDAFDIPAPRPGDVWYINFMRWWQTIRSGIRSWAWGNRTMNDEGNERTSAPAGRMVFGAPGVIVRQNGIGAIAEGRVEISADLINTDAKERSVTCVLETNSGELADEKTFAIPAGGKAVYEFKNRTIQELTAAEWTKKTPCRVEGVRKVALASLAVENHFWIEYDGLVWTTLKLIPAGSVRVKSLAFEIPFTQAFSDVINALDYSMRSTGKFKPPGYVGGAHATWLGNAYGGIQWDIETTGPFEVADPNTCVRVLNTPEGGTMRIEIINQETTLAKPREIAFGFIATPARPKMLRTTSGGIFRRYANSIGYWQDPEPAWQPFHQKWVNPSAVQRGRIWPLDSGIEARPVHHTTLCMMAGVDEAMQEFGDEWLLDSTIRWRNSPEAKRATRVTTNSKTLVDYIVWRFHEYFKREPMAGGYFDVSMPEYSANPYAGAGYVRDDGTREPQMNLMGHRMVAKRIFNLQNSVFPGGGLWWHASEGPRLIYMSYCIGNYDGENGNSIINGDNPTYRTLLTPDHYRAQYMGSNWGHWNAFLSQGRIRKETLEKYGFPELWDQWTGLQWLHDCYTSTGWFSNVGHLEGLLAQRDAVPFNQYHMFSPFNRFIGYWEQTIAKVDKPEFYASFYIKEPLKPVPHYGVGAWPFYSTYDTGLDGIHQAALVFYNHGMYEGEVRLALDWKQLGFDDVSQVKAVNAVHSTGFRVPDWNKPIPELAGELYDKSDTEYARIENGEVVFPITQYNYRLIILQAPKPWVGQKEIKPAK